MSAHCHDSLDSTCTTQQNMVNLPRGGFDQDLHTWGHPRTGPNGPQASRIACFFISDIRKPTREGLLHTECLCIS